MNRAVLWLALGLVGAGCAGASDSANTADADAAGAPAAEASSAAAPSPEAAAMLASIKEASAKYEDINVALAEGFFPDPSGMCVTADMVGLPAEQGAMGVHYAHPGRLGLTEGSEPVDGTDGVLDWTQPEVLVYEPQADGSMKLAAVEFLVFKAPWEAAGNAAPPSFFGTPFFSMANDPATPADEAHGFTPHYELHMWLPRENPNGVFAEFNPAVSCQHAAGQPHGG
jgi:hypothetical protein